MIWYVVIALCAVLYSVLICIKFERDRARSQYWTALRPRKQLIPWGRAKHFFKRLKVEFCQSRRASRKAQDMVSEMRKAGHLG